MVVSVYHTNGDVAYVEALETLPVEKLGMSSRDVESVIAAG